MLGLASIAYMTSTTAIVQVISTPSMHGRVLALQTVLMIGTTPLGGPLLGWIADNWGARLPVAIGAVGALGAALYGWLAGRSLGTGEADRALPAPEPEEVPTAWS